MRKEVKIGNAIYKIPIYGKNKWGENATALLEALVSTVGNIVGPEDILIKESILLNNISTPTDINGLKLDTSIVQNSVINGVIVRIFTAISLKEPTQDSFVIEATSFEGKMEYTPRYQGTDAKVKISGLDNGQFQYVSENIADTESIFIKFYAKAIIDEVI
jgi:hypothetical protein